ncbi:MAG: dTDP-4-dehydrorhamnose 3,5-epimerase [Azorhizobium sp. 35-67-15]|nr:MAG: dTDP-4-dehydrorhamnose 3,5-epimerase [Azorhizobium sp. 35-67-15]
MTSFTPLAIPEVMLIIPPRFNDPRGHFSETYVEGRYNANGISARFVQDNESVSVPVGTIRGLHFQVEPFAQAKLVRVLAGAVFDVAVDIRKGSPTYGRWVGATLTEANREQLFVPRGFAHAFCTLEPNTKVAYKVDGVYSRDSEGGIAWDDPDLAIEWPVKDALLSDKDREWPRLKDYDSPFTYA